MIIVVGILVLIGIAYFATKNQKRTYKFESDTELTLSEFEQRYPELKFKGGTLRFFGNWFGRPMDNYHEIRNVELDNKNNIITLTFDQDEELKVWNPSSIQIGKKELRIRKADKVLFKWHLYGEEKIEQNLRYDSYINNGISIEFETDFLPKKRNTQCHISEPALSIIGY